MPYWRVVPRGGTPSSTSVLWTATGGGGFSVNGNFAGLNGQLSGYSPVVADFNRDGRTDVWWYIPDGVTAGGSTQWMSTSSGTFTVAAGPPVPTGSRPARTGREANFFDLV